MASFNPSNIVVGFGVVLGAGFLLKEALFPPQAKENTAGTATRAPKPYDEARDFVLEMRRRGKRLVIFYGSQTGTAHEYAKRLAKEAEENLGLAGLVCDADAYDYEKLDQVPQDSVVMFVMATASEGEPTTNAATLVENILDDNFMYSSGRHTLDTLKYVIFGLGNRSYTRFNYVARQLDEALTKSGAKRIGERGEGDDSESTEEDYLAWRYGMWEELSEILCVDGSSDGHRAS